MTINGHEPQIMSLALGN